MNPLTGRIASLNHEVSDTAMKYGVVVVAPLAQQDKVVTCFRNHVGVELNVQITQ